MISVSMESSTVRRSSRSTSQKTSKQISKGRRNFTVSTSGEHITAESQASAHSQKSGKMKQLTVSQQHHLRRSDTNKSGSRRIHDKPNSKHRRESADGTHGTHAASNDVHHGGHHRSHRHHRRKRRQPKVTKDDSAQNVTGNVMKQQADNTDTRDQSVQPDSQACYWLLPGGPGCQFLRTCLGGVGSSNSDTTLDAWEYMDIARAVAKEDFKNIQDLYDKIASTISNDGTYVDVADMLGIPRRVFIIPTLLQGFEVLLKNREISAFSFRENSSTNNDEAVSASLAARTDFKTISSSPPGSTDRCDDVTAAARSKIVKSWKELHVETHANRKDNKHKVKSFACTVM